MNINLDSSIQFIEETANICQWFKAFVVLIILIKFGNFNNFHIFCLINPKTIFLSCQTHFELEYDHSIVKIIFLFLKLFLLCKSFSQTFL
jgi:hypothetical protein